VTLIVRRLIAYRLHCCLNQDQALADACLPQCLGLGFGNFGLGAIVWHLVLTKFVTPKPSFHFAHLTPIVWLRRSYLNHPRPWIG
jgi:hypothetical protein